MTREEAERVTKGAVVIHHDSHPPYHPIRVTEAWTSPTTGRRYLRLASLGVLMAPATEYGRPAATWVWAERAGEWRVKSFDGPPVAPDDLRRRMAADEEVAHVVG